jgi:CBS domain containing-hemolysin-like protein
MEGEEESRFNIFLKSIFRKWIKDNTSSKTIVEYKNKDIFNTLKNRRVKEIMTIRSDMIVVGSKASMSELIRLIADSGYSKIPVIEENIDNIIGTVYAKDIFKFFNKPDVSIKDIIRLPFFIPETKNVYELLQEFKKEKRNIAIVIDEYGGTSGIVTFYDIIEEIVGDIEDEERDIIKLDNGSFLIDATINISDLREIDINIERGEYETLSGFIHNLIGRIPKEGEEICYKNFKIIIVSANERKISRVKIIKYEV